jgi:hypothetical protein
LTKNIHKIDINTPDPGYEPFPVSIMNRITHEVMTFDPSHDKPAAISYSLNKPGCIRIRIVHREQPNLIIRTLQDWTSQGFGKYEVKWDGRDASGNIVDNKRMFVLFEAKDQGKGRQHHDHHEGLCRDPSITIKTLPDPFQFVKGTIEIQASLVGESCYPPDEAGYEARYYIDYKLYKVEKFEKGINNFIFKLDTKTLQNGDHLITVNVDDLHDHIGSAGLRVSVEN